MPIYEYVCQDCGQKYDKFVRTILADVELECPTCGSSQAKKAFSAFSTSSSNSSSMAGNIPAGPACGPVG